MLFEYQGVQVIHPDDMTEVEAKAYVDEQLLLMPAKTLTKVELSLEGAEVLIRPRYNTISRVRRITGYLSTIPKFNDAKKAEARDRVAHVR